MSFVALLSAQDPVDSPTNGVEAPLRALLPVAGMTIIEQQAERARAAGASKLLVLVDAVPSGLVQACDRIRARGGEVELIRDGADVAEQVEPGDRLLLVADGLLAGEGAWSAITGARDATLMTTADTLATRDLERLDPDTRWGGLAMLASGFAQRLADLPDGWDPLLAAVRQAAQDGAQRLPWDDGQFAAGEMAVAGSSEVAGLVEQRIITARDARERGWGERWIVASVVRLAGGWLLARPASGLWARGAAAVLLAGGIGAMLAGEWLGGAIAAFLSSFATGGARFVARFRPEPHWAAQAGVGAFVLTLLALVVAERGATLSPPSLGAGGVGVALLALVGPRLAAEDDPLGHPDAPALFAALIPAVLLLGHDIGGVLVSALVAAWFAWRWFSRS